MKKSMDNSIMIFLNSMYVNKIFAKSILSELVFNFDRMKNGVLYYWNIYWY